MRSWHSQYLSYAKNVNEIKADSICIRGPDGQRKVLATDTTLCIARTSTSLVGSPPWFCTTP